MEFAIGGICNCICCMPICSICFVDPAFSELVVSEKANLKNMIRLLSSTNENTLISAMATLYYLMDYPQGLTSSFSFFLLIFSPFEGFCPNRAYYLLHLRECQDSEHGIMHTVSSVPCFQQTHTLSLLIRKTSKPVRRVYLHLTAHLPILCSHVVALLPLIPVSSFIHGVLLPLTPHTRSNLADVIIYTRSVSVMTTASIASSIAAAWTFDFPVAF